MISAAAASSIYPVASQLPDPCARNLRAGVGYGNLGGIRSKSAASGGLQVKANAQASPKINGSPAGLNIADDAPSSPSPNRYDMCTDPYGLGRFVQDSRIFRQSFSIRSYEVGADRTASIETLMNHLQESSINYIKSAGLFGDGFGSTVEMCKRNLIWVVTRTQVEVDRYPTWGDVVLVDTRTSTFGKNRMRRYWLVRDSVTSETLARGTSVFVMINKETRKLSKIPDEVWREMEDYITNYDPALEEDGKKLPKIDDDAYDYALGSLTPKWSDVDMNNHVNNIKYVTWILESAPSAILESHELSSLTIEYRRECGMDNVIQSLTSITNSPVSNMSKSGKVECLHLLRLETGLEIVRARTKWVPKSSNNFRLSALFPRTNVTCSNPSSQAE